MKTSDETNWNKMHKKYIIPPISEFQVGDLVRCKPQNKNWGHRRDNCLGIIFNIKQKSDTSMCYETLTATTNEYTVYEIFWQQDIPGLSATTELTSPYLQLVWSNNDQNKLAKEIGLADCETAVAGSVCLKWSEK